MIRWECENCGEKVWTALTECPACGAARPIVGVLLEPDRPPERPAYPWAGGLLSLAGLLLIGLLVPGGWWLGLGLSLLLVGIDLGRPQ